MPRVKRTAPQPDIRPADVPPAFRASAARASAPLMQDRPNRWRLMFRRQKKFLRPGLAGFCLLAGFLLVASLVHVLGTGADFRERLGNAAGGLGLRVREISIVGRQKTPENLVRAALGISQGDPIMGFSISDARKRLETINWVQSATIERRLPGSIVVKLTERSPFAVWQYLGKFSLIDREGNMVTDSDVSAFAGQLPLVVGEGAPKAAAALLDAVAAQPALQGRVLAAIRVGDRRWNLHMTNGADILLPEGATAQALAKLVELHASHGLLDRPLQAVDLRLPDRLVIRPFAEKSASDKAAPPAAQPASTTAPPPSIRKPT
jgi:cell division protein FtsQ